MVAGATPILPPQKRKGGIAGHEVPWRPRCASFARFAELAENTLAVLSAKPTLGVALPPRGAGAAVAPAKTAVAPAKIAVVFTKYNKKVKRV